MQGGSHKTLEKESAREEGKMNICHSYCALLVGGKRERVRAGGSAHHHPGQEHFFKIHQLPKGFCHTFLPVRDTNVPLNCVLGEEPRTTRFF